MNESAHTPPAAEPFELHEQVGTVELDRYCTHCGYNLRQQAIRRETHTKLLLCACPECGTYEPANTHTTATRSWFRFIVVIFWLIWLAIWLNMIGWSVFGITGLAVVSGNMCRTWVDFDQVDKSRLVQNDALKNYYQQFQNNNNNNNNSQAAQYYYGPGDVVDRRPMRKDDIALVAFFFFLSAAIGATLTGITTVAMPHWRRWGYLVFAVGVPLIAIIIFSFLWNELYNWRVVTVDLVRWHQKIGIGILLAALGASVVAVWLGRPVTRGIIRVIVPPGLRGMFAYLWLADGKTPPKTA